MKIDFKIPILKNCVTLFTPSEEQKEKAIEAGIRLITYQELVDLGATCNESELEKFEGPGF